MALVKSVNGLAELCSAHVPCVYVVAVYGKCVELRMWTFHIAISRLSSSYSPLLTSWPSILDRCLSLRRTVANIIYIGHSFV